MFWVFQLDRCGAAGAKQQGSATEFFRPFAHRRFMTDNNHHVWARGFFPLDLQLVQLAFENGIRHMQFAFFAERQPEQFGSLQGADGGTGPDLHIAAFIQRAGEPSGRLFYFFTADRG